MESSPAEDVDVLIAMTRRLKEAISGGAASDDVDAAVRNVERAAEEQGDRGAARVQRFEPGLREESADFAAEDALAAIAFDLHAGNVLVAAAQAKSTGDVATLDMALRSLEGTRGAVAQASQERARFDAMPTAAEAGINDQNALDEFRQRTALAMEGLVKDSNEVLGKVFEALMKLDPSNIVNGIATFADKSDDLKAAGRLLRNGLAKLQDGYHALLKLVGEEPLRKIKEKVEDIWRNVKSGKYTNNALRLIYDQKEINEQVARVLAEPRLDRNAVIQGCDDLAPLGPRFGKQMALLGAIVSAVTVASAVLAFTSVSVQAAPFIAGAYLIVIGAVLVIGREFAGVEYSAHWIRGVGQITRELVAAD